MDPFGALAHQRRGDVGVFDGVQWQSSNQGAPFSVSGITDSNSGVNFIAGSAAVPITNPVGATVLISRAMKADGGGDANAALWVVNTNNGTTQPVAIQAYADNSGSGDTVAVYSRSIARGTGNAIGTFTIAQALTGAVGMAGNNVVMANTSGSNYVYASSGAVSAGVALQSIGTNTLTAGVGFGIFATPGNTSQFDVGFAIHPAMVATTSFLDESSSTTSISITGDHSNAAIYILNNNAAHYAQLWQRTNTSGGTTAGYWGLLVHSTGDIHIDEPGVAQKFVWTKGTPGANKTCLYIQEGAGPTLRQVTTFDPGAAGVNFTAGQLVMVAV